ncbi:glycosyltransferase family 4 protein [Alphaproteobacteria bacterium]|nr:glycosyltransferase family 4 protein [Alphaproteobacteria bacterium]
MESNTKSASAKATPTVLQILPSLVTGGVERGTVDVAQALTNAGWNSIVASSGGIMVREVERGGGRHIAMPVDSKNPLVIKCNISRIIKLVHSHSVDILHVRSRAPAWSALSAARRTNVPLVTTFHGNYGASNPLKRWYNSVMARGDRVIAISEFIREQVCTRYGADPAKVRVIPRGVDTGLFDPAAVSAQRVIQLAEQWRLPDDARVVMLPGRLTRWKGHRVLIDAIARLEDRNGLRCILVGSDQGRSAYLRELEREISRRNLQDTVQIVGDCRDMSAAFMLADVVVSTSVEAEAFGRVIAEAQAMGRSVIATDHGAARETVTEKETGWLVPPGDASALATALWEALTLDAATRDALAKRVIENVRADYTKELMCERTLSVYGEVLAEKQAHI